MKATVAAAFPLFSLAFGAVNWSALESCITESGTSPVKTVSTSTSTTTIQQPDVVVKHTVHPQHWVTPRPFTQTWTHTVHETDTAVSTVTVHLTHTELIPTSTIIDTVTQTHVSNVYTTIAAPAGFLPVSNTTNSVYPGAQSESHSSSSAGSSSSSASSSSSSLASSSVSSSALFSASSVAASFSTATASASSTAAVNYNATTSSASAQNASATLSASANLDARGLKDIKQFAHLVHCLKSVLIQKTIDSTFTGAAQTSTLAQATSTTTVSTTTTTMVQPKWGHGQTVYTTAWTTVTKNYNAHSVQTVTAEVTSTIKAYAACQTNNILRPVASLSGKGKYKTTLANSAQQCCEQCQQTSNCVGSAYQQLLPIGGRCLIYYADSCPAQSANSLEYFTSASKSGNLGTYAVSNGQCGYMYSGGQAAAQGHGF